MADQIDVSQLLAQIATQDNRLFVSQLLSQVATQDSKFFVSQVMVQVAYTDQLPGPNQENLLRHGTWFGNGIKNTMWWAK